MKKKQTFQDLTFEITEKIKSKLDKQTLDKSLLSKEELQFSHEGLFVLKEDDEIRSVNHKKSLEFENKLKNNF